MRDLQNKRVLRAVVHLVMPRRNRLLLSESELPIDQEVREFLEGLVSGGLRDSQAKAANFVVQGSDRPSGLCDRLLGPRPSLVGTSQALAQRLYDVTLGDDRISDATLAVLICEGREPNQANARRFVALLKLDPSDAFRTVEDTDEEGKKLLRFQLQSDILPSTEAEIQKCAFVRSPQAGEEYRLLLIDRQTRARIAKFFVSDFLGTEFVLDAEERTKRLYRSLRRARNEVAGSLDASTLAALDQFVDGAVVGQSVNLDQLVESLPVTPEVRTQVDEIVTAELPDREFELDREVARQFLRRRTFEGDNGLRVSVPRDFTDMIRVSDVPNTDPPVRRITIETRQWIEK